MYSYLILWWQI